MLIGLTGNKRSGKNTVADMLPPHFSQVAFADTIKEIIRVCYCVEEPEDKEALLKDKALYPYFGSKVTYRLIMQTLGQELKQHNPNIFIDAVRSKIQSNTIVTDVRFDNEAKFIKENKGIIIKINKNTGLVDNDISEAGISPNFIDFFIDNNSTREQLQIEVDNLYKRLTTLAKFSTHNI